MTGMVVKVVLVAAWTEADFAPVFEPKPEVELGSAVAAVTPGFGLQLDLGHLEAGHLQRRRRPPLQQPFVLQHQPCVAVHGADQCPAWTMASLAV